LLPLFWGFGKISVVWIGEVRNILLDAWRNSGNLFFIKIEEDKKYVWEERFYIEEEH